MPLGWAIATLLVSLRIAPALAFAQPFTLVRTPAIVRVLLAVALAGWLVAANPANSVARLGAPETWAALAAGELLLGIALALALQLAFAAILTVGRAIDIQAGFGLAAVVDPTTKAQLPLVGTFFSYGAAALFFSGSGPADLLAIWSASLAQAPLGASLTPDIVQLTGFLGAVFASACGLGAMLMLALFLADAAIAFMSRTLPQMNVMMLGFQVKALITLALLPPTIAISGSLFLRLLRTALDAAPLMVVAHG